MTCEGFYQARSVAQAARRTTVGTGDIFELNVLGFIIAVIASVLLIGVAEAVAGRNRTSVR